MTTQHKLDSLVIRFGQLTECRDSDSVELALEAITLAQELHKQLIEAGELVVSITGGQCGQGN